jgi:hypothetical protein
MAQRERRHRNDARDARVSARVRPSRPPPTPGRSDALEDAGGASRQRAGFNGTALNGTAL